MTESKGNFNMKKLKTDFLNRVLKAKSEIKTNFKSIRKIVDQEEAKILKKVDEIERDILESYARASASLKEISKVREQVLTGLKSNSTSKLQKKNLKMYDDEIKEIRKNSNIDSTIELKWGFEHLTRICEVSSSVNPYRNFDIHSPSGQTPEMFERTSLFSSQVDNDDSISPQSPVRISNYGPLYPPLNNRDPCPDYDYY